MDPKALPVLRRFLAFKYQPKETKQSKVDRLWRLIREKTGLGRGVAENIADAIVRGRDVEGLKYQKGWPIEFGIILGPTGTLSIQETRTASDTQKYRKKWTQLHLEAYAIQSSMVNWPMMVHLEGRTDRIRHLLDKTDARKVRRAWVMSTDTAEKLFPEIDALEASS